MKVYVCFPQGKAKALTMSYDDGKVQDERLVGIFNRHGIRGTFNLNYGMLGQKPRLSAERIRELYTGHEIATHTMTHPTIARCPLTAVAEELLEDRKGLERLTGQIIRGHAYPNGSYNEEIKTLLRGLGLAYARVVRATGEFELPTDPYEWHPTCHHNDPGLMDKARFFAEFPKKQYLKLMYVWGHSYEFDQNDNWQVMEEFCAYMGGRDDIWYATNIEIIDYMEAASALRFSADSSRVFNPSAVSVWLAVDDDNYVEAKGGCMTELRNASEKTG